MKVTIKSFLKTIFVLLFLPGQCSAQQDSNYVHPIKNYIHFVDSFYDYSNAFELNKKDTSKYIVTKIEEGSDETEWWDITTTSDTKNDSVFKISTTTISYKYEMFIDQYFYYKSNKLIYAALELRHKPSRMSVKYSAKEFYANGNVMLRNNQVDSLPEEYIWIRKLNMYENGNKYLLRYLSRE